MAMGAFELVNAYCPDILERKSWFVQYLTSLGIIKAGKGKLSHEETRLVVEAYLIGFWRFDG